MPSPDEKPQFVNVFVHGAVGAGKSVLINDLITAFGQAAGDSTPSSSQDGS